MAKEFNFAEYDFAANEACFTPEELDTLKRLDRTGTPVFLAPIEIEDRNQFESLHITQAHCRTWRIGSEQVLVHLTPADEATYRFLLNELRTKHRKGYRSVRCMVPGRQKPLIRCPDTNKCSDCPYGRKPEDRDPNEISWDGLIEAGTEPKITDHTTPQAETELMYKELLDLMAREDPDIAKAYNWREHLGYDVKEIANKLQLSDRQVRYLLQKAETIRVKYINA